MFGVKTTGKRLFDPCWQTLLSEYVTAIAWSSQGFLAVASAAGEVILWDGSENADFQVLQEVTDTSIDCLDFSYDGQFLAVGGQNGEVKVWRIGEAVELVATLDNSPQWIDKLSWSPTEALLAFNLGRYVQVWDATTQSVIATLAFEASSVLAMEWRPNGSQIAVAGDSGIMVWDRDDWDEDPYFLAMGSASIAIAWSKDSKYLASSNLDYTITVLEWLNPYPWVMRGFSGKVRNLTWSDSLSGNTPVLAASCSEAIVTWKKSPDDQEGWNPQVLELHTGTIQDLAFRPHSLLLASTGDDAWLCLVEKGKNLAQVLDGAANGYACLAWHPQGQRIAAGGQGGELQVWQASKRGKGFG